MNKRLFEIGDKVQIKSDDYADYGNFLDKCGEIVVLGVRVKGRFTYLVKTPNMLDYNIRVFEEDLVKI